MGYRDPCGYELQRNEPETPPEPESASVLPIDDLALDSFNEHRERRRGEEEQSAYLRRLER